MVLLLLFDLHTFPYICFVKLTQLRHWTDQISKFLLNWSTEVPGSVGVHQPWSQVVPRRYPRWTKFFRGKTKSNTCLYQERRFTKLRCSCAFILDAIPYIQMMLNETNLSNLHTEIVQLFLDNELLSTELLCLAYFTHRVSLPLLYAVEVCNQDELCYIFPRLYNYLINGSMDSLSTYIVKYSHSRTINFIGKGNSSKNVC